MKNKIITKTTSIILALIMIVSTVTVSMTSAAAVTPAADATLTSIPSGVISTLASVLTSILKPVLVYGLEQASDATNDDGMQKAISYAIKIIDGSETSMQKEILKEINLLSKQVDALYTFTAESFNHIDDNIKDLKETTAKNALSEKRNELRKFKEGKYEPMLQTYSMFLNAFVTYGNCPSEANRKNLNTTFEKVLKYANNPDVMQDFQKDLNDFLMLISPYNPNFDTTSPELSANCDEWGTKGNYKTYLDYLFGYITQITDFENNVFDYMTAGVNEVGSIAYMYLQSYKFYIQVEALILNSNADVTSDAANKKTEKMQQEFQLTSLKLTRGLNQMHSIYENVFNTYMRSYDTLAHLGINNHKDKDKVVSTYNSCFKDAVFILKTAIVDCTNEKEKTFSSDIISNSQWVYQFKLVSENNDNSYAIRNSNSTDKDGDTTNRRFAYQDTVEEEILLGKESCFSLDFINLTRGLSNNLKMLSSQSQINAIKNSNAYVSSNNLIKNIRRELSIVYGNDIAIPDLDNKAPNTDESTLKSGLFLLLNSNLTWKCDAQTLFISDDADMNWLNISMPLDGNHEVEIDSENDIVDNTKNGGSLRDKEAYAMFCGSAKSSHYINTAEIYGSGDVYTEVNGKVVNTEGKSSGKLNSGDVMKIKIKPDANSTIESIQIKNTRHDVIDILLASEFDSNGKKTFDSQELVDILPKDENGYIEFVLPVPYQDVQINVIFKQIDDSLIDHKVILDNDRTETTMQFTSYDFVTTKEFKKDEVVTISVMPDEGKICTGVSVIDQYGYSLNPQYIGFKEVTDSRIKLKPNEKIYQFNMLHHDMTIKPIIEQGYVVDFRGDSNTDHTFTHLNCFNFMGNAITTWEKGNSITYKEGDRVTIEITAAKGHFITDIDVFTDTKQIPTVITNDTEISFIMPKENVHIVVSSGTDSSAICTVNLVNYDRLITDVDFVTENMHKMNINQNHYKCGDTVRIVTKGTTPDKIRVTDSDGKNIEVDIEHTTENTKLNSDEHLFTFTMPDVSFINIVIEKSV